MLLALPELVARLHTSISHVIWVIVVYNLALIAGSIAIRLAPRTPPVEPMLIGGLLLFGAASLASGLAPDLTTLLIARGFQGAGGAVLLCASLPPMARAAAAGDTSPLARLVGGGRDRRGHRPRGRWRADPAVRLARDLSRPGTGRGGGRDRRLADRA